jgi:hypothetical protein
MQSPCWVTIDTLHRPSKRSMAKLAVAASAIDAAVSAPASMPVRFLK